MKIRTIIAANVALLVLAGMAAQAADTVKLAARPGSKMRVEGTSNIHDWRVVSPMVGGAIDVGPEFPVEPGKEVKPGKIAASGEVFVTSRSLKSIKEDGSPYNDSMDSIMHEKLDAQKTPRISYSLKELTLKEAPQNKEAPYVFDSKGELTVAGVTKEVSFPVNVMPLGEKKVKITGSFPLKMTDFNIEPPAPKIAFGMIKTGDDVKVVFEWMVAQR